MFNIGGWEFLIILLVALIVLGPERLPGAAKQVGQTLGTLRQMAQSLQTEFEEAVAEATIDAELEDQAAAQKPQTDSADDRPETPDETDRRHLAAEAEAAFEIPVSDATDATDATDTTSATAALEDPPAPPAETPTKTRPGAFEPERTTKPLSGSMAEIDVPPNRSSRDDQV